jgi:ribosomal protein S18 acetylase RimI-like enzyme
MKIVKKYGEISFTRINGNYFIEQITIHPQFRGKGFGNKLIKFFPKKCYFLIHPNQNSLMSLNSLISFYKKNGFVLYIDNRTTNIFGFRNINMKKVFNIF